MKEKYYFFQLFKFSIIFQVTIHFSHKIDFFQYKPFPNIQLRICPKIELLRITIYDRNISFKTYHEIFPQNLQGVVNLKDMYVLFMSTMILN